MAEKDMKRLSDDEIELVAGGTQEENDQIVALFRKHGFEKEAKRLEGRSLSFGSELSSVLKGMGFTHKLEIYYFDDTLNRKFYNGRTAQQSDVLEILDDFLYRTANNIEWWR